MDITELSIKAYIQARKRLNIGYRDYISRCKEAGQSTIILPEDVEPYAALNEAIFWGIALYERKNDKLDGFTSGIKYVNNVAKHEKQIFTVSSFCSPGLEITAKVNDSPSGPIIENVNITPSLLFGEIEDLTEDKKTRQRRIDYNNCIKGKSIPETIERLDTILMTMYPCDLWDSLGCQ